MGDPTLDSALKQASDELGLDEWYRDCVRPLLRDGPARYPRCCGGGCEPCNQLLVRVAERTRELMALAPPA
ncbi:MAG: hypothetical protein U0270_23655 [Labilithrix sp.]